MDSWATGYKTYSSANIAPKGYKYYGSEAKMVGNHVKRYIIYKKTITKKTLIKTPKTKVYISITSTDRGITASLYHLKCKYDGESWWHIGKPKKIFI